MKEKIKELQDYFKGKILNEQYTLVQNDGNNVVLEIDGLIFVIWIASFPEKVTTSTDTYDKKTKDNIYLKFHSFIQLNFTVEEKNIIFTRFKKEYKSREITLLKEEQKCIEEKIKQLEIS